MAIRKSFLLRVDPQTYKEIEKWAHDELRSVNGQIEFILKRALRERGRTGMD
ncbi:MAG: Arc family DNA binding domain-containing protein [Elusimicrobia bacterium]|nr:MAG: Arc family DNA binding domain-containing protein [Elusimicrobiota bacterium]